VSPNISLDPVHNKFEDDFCEKILPTSLNPRQRKSHADVAEWQVAAIGILLEDRSVELKSKENE
jgi:hypothetical protein